MANVVDPNSWRMIPLPEPQQSKGTGARADRPATALTTSDSSLRVLSSALARTFSADRDRVVWTFLPPGLDQHLRVDGRHTEHVRDQDSESATPANLSGERPWLVLVQSSAELASGNGSQAVREALEQDVRLLIVACGVEDASVPLDRQLASAAHVASRLRFDFLEPQEASEEEDLAKALARVKHGGRSSIVYFNPQAPALPRPHFTPSGMAAIEEPASEASHSYRDLIAEVLGELALSAVDVRAFTTDGDPRFAVTATDGVVSRLAECLAQVSVHAAAGQHTFVLLSLDEAVEAVGLIRRHLATGGMPVTLIIEARPGEAAVPPVSASLAPLRQMPGVSLLSPKDGVELRQMVHWCASQDEPAAIWLPDDSEPQVTWPRGEEIAHGRAERLGAGTDVALVAWGTAAAAAGIAAENLVQLGIDSTVVNARFAQPLDVDVLVAACSQAAYVVLIDDASEAGFAAWTSELLLKRGLGARLTIVSPKELAPGQSLKSLHSELALRVVDACRWLGEHLDDASEGVSLATVVAPERIIAAEASFDDTCQALPILVTRPETDVQAQVLARQFSPCIQDWVDNYAKVGSRDVYLWRWCLHGLDLTTLSCVVPQLRQDLCDTKLLAVMYGVMLDDVADQAGGEEFLAALIGIIAGRPERDFRAFTSHQQQYAQFTCDLWDTFRGRLKCSPCFEEYAELLDYDHRQILNTFAYSAMVNKQPTLLNVQEHDMYLPHNMQMMSFATMDLMCSPEFDRQELGRLREIIWHAQNMGRIGNLVSTWQREIADRDFTSGVFARALRQGDLTLADLDSASPAAIEAAVRRGRHEDYFLRKWEAHRQSIEALSGGIQSVDIAKLLDALTQLMQMELDSRGLK